MTTKADLDAANRETRRLMDQLSVLREDARNAYSKGYRDALHVAGSLAAVNKTQAELIAFYMRTLVDGWK